MKPDERKKLLRDRGSRDVETKCMQEVAERHRGAGEIRILKQHKRKKLWRGQRGEPTYETKWMQEVERHIGGRES